ncbi:hypothetical protein C8J57DRAFT_1235358 [Mycena rebaudengoi]|nr:hypothetical protein C8J57DRAFT_1235358 [Mycena rebaudengoi]
MAPESSGMLRAFSTPLFGEHECVGRNDLRAVSIKAAPAVAKVGPSHAVDLDTVTIIRPVSWANCVGADSSRVAEIAASPRLAEGVGALQRTTEAANGEREQDSVLGQAQMSMLRMRLVTEATTMVTRISLRSEAMTLDAKPAPIQRSANVLGSDCERTIEVRPARLTVLALSSSSPAPFDSGNVEPQYKQAPPTSCTGWPPERFKVDMYHRTWNIEQSMKSAVHMHKMSKLQDSFIAVIEVNSPLKIPLQVLNGAVFCASTAEE